MNIAIVINSLRIGGGAERVASTVGSALSRRGHNVFFGIFKNTDIKYPIEGKCDLLETKVSVKNSLLAFLNIFLRGRKIAKYCRENNIDAVVSFMEEANFASVISRVLFGNKSRLVLSVRENPRFKKKKAKIMMKYLHKRADRVVANSRAVERILNREFGLEKTFTIYNPIDYEKIRQESGKDMDPADEKLFKTGDIFINVGRLTRQKGHWHLIRAFSEVVKFKPEAKLVILGDGELRKDYEGMIKGLGLSGNVFLLGRKTNVFPYLAKSKCFLFSSLWEGMPNTVMEAAAMGLPIISTDCPTGAREIIAPELDVEQNIEYPYRGEYGVLLTNFHGYPFYEGIEQKSLEENENMFAQAILNILGDEKMMKKKIKEREEFSLGNVAEEWEMLIKGEL